METFNTAYMVDLFVYFKHGSAMILGLFLTLWLNVHLLRHISINYEIRSRICLSKNKPHGVIFNYFLAITFLMIVQILVIIGWGLALYALSLIKDLREAIIFAGSCYTTLGYAIQELPESWRFIPVVIGLSGLFAIALATAAMINMSALFRQAWLLKHASQIRAILERENIEIPEFIEVQEIIKVKTGINASKKNVP
jgi:hypothetical protein